MDDDIELLRRYADQGAEDAFAALVERHIGLVYGSALRQLGGAAHRAQDVTQTVFIDLARKSARLSRRSDIVGWLYLSTHFAAAKLKRGEQRRQQREEQAMQMLTSSGVDDIRSDQLAPVLDAALHDLCDRDRELILWRFFQNQKFAHLGERLGLSENAARMRLERALDKLRAQLARRGITSSTAALTTALAHPSLTATPAGLSCAVTTAALTAGVGAVGTSAAAVFFMSKSTALTCVVAIGALGYATLEYARRRHAEAAAIAAEVRLAGLRTELAETQQRAETAAQRAAAALPNPVALAPVPALSGSEAARPAAGVISLGGSSSSGTSPAGVLSLAEAFATGYASLFRQLGFTPDQRERFIALMVEWKERGNERVGAAIQSGAPRETLTALVRDEINPQRDAAIRATLGEGVFRAFEDFEANHGLRRLTEQLATTLYHTDTPLEPAQADQLVTLMAAHARTPGGKVDLLALNSEAMMAQAQAMLRPPQLAAFRRAIKQTQFEQRAGRPVENSAASK